MENLFRIQREFDELLNQVTSIVKLNRSVGDLEFSCDKLVEWYRENKEIIHQINEELLQERTFS